TVVEVEPERTGIELVGEVLADVDQAAPDLLTDPRRSVHDGRMDPVEVDRVGMRAGVDEVDAESISFAGAERGTWHSSVVRPGCVLDAGNDLDLLVVGDKFPLAEDVAAGEPM